MREWGGGFYVQHKVSLKYEKCEVFTTTIRGKPPDEGKQEGHLHQTETAEDGGVLL